MYVYIGTPPIYCCLFVCFWVLRVGSSKNSNRWCLDFSAELCWAEGVWFKWNRQAESYWKGGQLASLSSACPEVSVPKLSQCIIRLLCSHIDTCHWPFVWASAFLSRCVSLVCLNFSMSPPPRCGQSLRDNGGVWRAECVTPVCRQRVTELMHD